MDSVTERCLLKMFSNSALKNSNIGVIINLISKVQKQAAGTQKMLSSPAKQTV